MDQSRFATSDAHIMNSLSRKEELVPIQIHTDQGKEFFNRVVDGMLKILGTQHTTTSAYHPQANAEVEKLNLTIQNNIRGTIQYQMGEDAS